MGLFNFGQTLRAYRVLRHWNQQELARQSGLSRQTISDLENGKAEPRHATVKALSEALQIPSITLEHSADGVLPGPPVLISPWPPYGITWQEVQVAISDFVTRRTQESLKGIKKALEGTGATAVIAELPVGDSGAKIQG